MIASAFHTASNGTNTNDFINSHKNMTQSGIQPHPTINATIDPELIKVIRTSHDAIQQQIEAIQATLQTMITVLNRNSLPPQPTEPPSHDPPIRELSPTPDRTTTYTPKTILLFDLSTTCQSLPKSIDTLALQLKHFAPHNLALQLNHHPPKYQDHLNLLEPSRDRRNRFLSPPLHAAPRNLRNIDLDIRLRNTFPDTPTHQHMNATDPLLDLLELSSYESHVPTARQQNPTLRQPYSVNIRPSYHPILSTQYDLLIYGQPTEAPHPKLWPNVIFVYR